MSLRVSTVPVLPSAPRLRFGILGLESANARAVADALERSRVAELVAVAGADVDRWCEDEDLEVRRYGSYDELVRDGDVDAVYVGTPTRLRASWCVAAALKGKHVLAEKPLAATGAEAARVVQACEQKQVVLMDAAAFVHHERSRMIVGKLRDERAFGSAPTRCDVCVDFAARSLDFVAGGDDDEPLGVVGDLGWFAAKWGLLAFGSDVARRGNATASVRRGGGGANHQQQKTTTTTADDGTHEHDHEHEHEHGKKDTTTTQKPPVELTGTVDFETGQQLQIHCSYCHAFRQDVTVSGDGCKTLRCDDFLVPKEGTASATFQVHTYADPPLQDLDGLVVSAAQTYSADNNRGTCDQKVSMIDAFVALARDPEKTAQKRRSWARAALTTQAIVDALLASAEARGRPQPIAALDTYVQGGDATLLSLAAAEKTKTNDDDDEGGGQRGQQTKKKKQQPPGPREDAVQGQGQGQGKQAGGAAAPRDDGDGDGDGEKKSKKNGTKESPPSKTRRGRPPPEVREVNDDDDDVDDEFNDQISESAHPPSKSKQQKKEPPPPPPNRNKRPRRTTTTSQRKQGRT